MKNAQLTSLPFDVADYRVDPTTLRVTRGEDEVRLESRPMQVLVYLAQRPGQTVSRDELQDELWPSQFVTEDAVTNAIGKLRRVFCDNPRDPEIIETIPKVGYRLIAEVKPVENEFSIEATEASAGSLASATTGESAGRFKIGQLWLIWAFVLIFLLGVGYTFLYSGEHEVAPRHGRTNTPTVAVLPFKNLGPSPEQDYFANGVTADLTTQLSRVSGLTVLDRSYVAGYSDDNLKSQNVSSEIAAQYVLKGSVQRANNDLRVNVQLIDTSSQRVMWGERYDGETGDIFKIQNRLTSGVLTALSVRLESREQAVLARSATNSVAAYDHYLRGLDGHGRRTRALNRSAMLSFQHAIELDSAFSKAHAGLALTYAREAIDGWVKDPIRSLELARRSAKTAEGLDPSDPQVHFVLGQIELFNRRHEEAIAATERAIRFNQNYADAHALKAWILSYAGRPRAALEAMKLATTLNPRPTASYLEVLGEIQFVQGDYRQSATTFQRVLQINPAYLRARMWNVAALAQAGDSEGAEWEATELMVQDPEFSLAGLAFSFPFKDPRHLDLVLQGLKKSGLR